MPRGLSVMASHEVNYFRGVEEGIGGEAISPLSDTRFTRAVHTSLLIRRWVVALRLLFAAQSREVITRLASDLKAPDLTHWIAASVRVLSPLVLAGWLEGMTQSTNRIARVTSPYRTPSHTPGDDWSGAVGSGDVRTYRTGNDTIFGTAKSNWLFPSSQRCVRKGDATLYQRGDASHSTRGDASPGVRYDLVTPRVLDAVEAATLNLCRATMDTSRLAVEEAVTALRGALRAGLSRGDAVRLLARDVGRIFRDPRRAFTIAATESARAMNGGAVMAAKDSGVVRGKVWVASGDACEACLDLDLEERGLDEPFFVDPAGGPYAVVMYPPLHPHCMCTVGEVV